MYGGQCSGFYAASLYRLTDAIVRKGMHMQFCAVGNEALVTRARNICAHKFLQSQCSHLLFVDSDIEFSPDDVFSIWETDEDVICGLYPKKDLSGAWVECGTGFMMIHRRVFDKFAKVYPHRSYVSDHDNLGRIVCFFNTEIVGDRYLSEDYNFCRLVREMGLKVSIAEWVKLAHLGTHKFVGTT